jgi:hypothetical protein
MSKNITMRSDNTGLTVKVNLWSMAKYLDSYNADRAHHWIAGQITHSNGKIRKFNDAGELLTILSKWNTEKFKELKAKSKTRFEIKTLLISHPH